MSQDHPRKLLEAGTACAMVLRVYPSVGQEKRAGHWLWVAQKFRNEAVAWLHNRRTQRLAWIHQHPALSKDWIPEEFRGSDTTACSQWLTARLAQARETVVRDLGLPADKQKMVEQVSRAFAQLSRGERDAITDGWLLTVPRTVLDQVIRDLEKTVNKAIADRRGRKTGKANNSASSKGSNGNTKRMAGFPRHRKHRYPSSIRLQVEANKNREFRDHWAAGVLWIPGLGKLKFRDHGYVLPNTPPKLITVARNAAGHWQVSFVCVAGEYQNARGRRIAKLVAQGLKPAGPQTLPRDPKTGLPTIEGIDASLPSRGVSNQYGALGRIRYLKRYARRLRFLDKSVARKEPGSKRWLKAKRAQGKCHVRIVNLRDAHMLAQAREVADRSAITCVEDLVLALMLQNQCLAQSAHDAALGKFKTLLARECAKRGHLLLEAPRFAPTTQTCPDCGFVNRMLKNNLKCRAWVCPGCGSHHDRDMAAAHNIQAMALGQAASRLAQGWTLDPSSGPENGSGMLSSHRLHPDLAAFIARGGLTALLTGKSGSESRILGSIGSGGGQDGAREARVLPDQPRKSCREQDLRG